MSGPEATAGSMWIFLKNNGMQVPTALEISIASSREEPMQADTAKAKIRVLPLNNQIYRSDQHKGHKSKHTAVAQTDTHFLKNKFQFLFAGEGFIHQYTDRYSQ